MPQALLICLNDRFAAGFKIARNDRQEAFMTFGEQAYVGMVIAAMAIFGLGLFWANMVAGGRK